MSAQSEALRLAIFCLEVKLDKRSPTIIIIDMMNLLRLAGAGVISPIKRDKGYNTENQITH